MEEPNASRGLQMPPVVGTLPATGTLSSGSRKDFEREGTNSMKARGLQV